MGKKLVCESCSRDRFKTEKFWDIVRSHGISIRNTSFNESSVTDGNPVGSDDEISAKKDRKKMNCANK